MSLYRKWFQTMNQFWYHVELQTLKLKVSVSIVEIKVYTCSFFFIFSPKMAFYKRILIKGLFHNIIIFKQ